MCWGVLPSQVEEPGSKSDFPYSVWTDVALFRWPVFGDGLWGHRSLAILNSTSSSIKGWHGLVTADSQNSQKEEDPVAG